MSEFTINKRYEIRIIEDPDLLDPVEILQNIVWPGDLTEVVPKHMLLAAIFNGGLVIGAYDLAIQESVKSDSEADQEYFSEGNNLIGFAFGFPGLFETPDGPRIKHASHMLGVHPNYRNQGIGFALKRAQWQMVRNRGIDLITWTYDPLQSRNAHLNINRLGATCKTYKRDAYGVLRDGINVGDHSDRFMVDWFIDSRRVSTRLSKDRRTDLDLAHFLSAETNIVNPTQIGNTNLPIPTQNINLEIILTDDQYHQSNPIVLVEIPSDFAKIKRKDPQLAIEWRLHTRHIFESFFSHGYLVTDFVFLPGDLPRSFYVLSYGESTL